MEETPTALNQPQIPIHNVQPFQLQSNTNLNDITTTNTYNPVTAYYIMTAPAHQSPYTHHQQHHSHHSHSHTHTLTHTHTPTYYDTPPPIVNTQLTVPIPNNDENLPPRSSSRIGVSRSFDSLLSAQSNKGDRNTILHDKLSVNTGYYAQQGAYTDDEMILKETASKVAPAANYGYGQALAPRRSSTTALDIMGQAGALNTNFRSKSSSPSRVASSSSPRNRKKSNVAQTSPRLLKKYNTWNNNIGMETKLPTKPQKKSKSMVYSPKGNDQHLPMTFNSLSDIDANTTTPQTPIGLLDSIANISRYHSNPETQSNIADVGGRHSHTRYDYSMPSSGSGSTKRHSDSRRKKRKSHKRRKSKTAQEKNIWDMEHKSAEDITNPNTSNIAIAREDIDDRKSKKKKKKRRRSKIAQAKESFNQNREQIDHDIMYDNNNNDNDDQYVD